ncbi:MAG TPA: hypothetical protein VFJ47_11895 [Terriglobales bacterium]|nr:hypothetical protein [Terriglobales bacterium]
MSSSAAIRPRIAEHRIRFIMHKDKQVLLVDLSQCTAEEVGQISKLVPNYVTRQPRGSVLLLADFTGAHVDRNAAEPLKRGMVLDRPHLQRSAWVGTESIPHVLYENIKRFSQRDLASFHTREEALDWLTKD